MRSSFDVVVEEAEDKVLRTREPEKDIGRTRYITTLILGAAGSLVLLARGVALIQASDESLLYPLSTSLSQASIEVIVLVITAVLTQIFEGLGFIYSLSLRWNLIKEDRLQYNTNLRLFNSSRNAGPNAWYINVLAAVCHVLGYTATSQLYIVGVKSGAGVDDTHEYVNCLAVMVLGLVIFIQTALGLWCLLQEPSATQYWTSNALNTTLVALSRGEVHHRKGRCMVSVGYDTAGSKPAPTRPSRRQPSMREARPIIVWIVFLLWCLFILATIWFVVIIISSRQGPGGLPWDFNWSWSIDRGSENWITLGMSPDYDISLNHSHIPFKMQVLVGLLFVMVFQGLQMLGLHVAELVVVTARDEDSWRRLARRDMTRHNAVKPRPFYSAFRSWKNNVLLVFKALLHWILGQSLIFQFYYFSEDYTTASAASSDLLYCYMPYGRLMIYALCTGLLAVFISYLAFKRPSGPQPATWGHLQTLADLVDNWETDEFDRFWWGDKGETNGVRHAGMSCRRTDLQDIRMNAVYV
jgi:hypothetical protein